MNSPSRKVPVFNFEENKKILPKKYTYGNSPKTPPTLSSDLTAPEAKRKKQESHINTGYTKNSQLSKWPNSPVKSPTTKRQLPTFRIRKVGMSEVMRRKSGPLARPKFNLKLTRKVTETPPVPPVLSNTSCESIPEVLEQDSLESVESPNYTTYFFNHQFYDRNPVPGAESTKSFNTENLDEIDVCEDPVIPKSKSSEGTSHSFTDDMFGHMKGTSEYSTPTTSAGPTPSQSKIDNFSEWSPESSLICTTPRRHPGRKAILPPLDLSCISSKINSDTIGCLRSKINDDAFSCLNNKINFEDLGCPRQNTNADAISVGSPLTPTTTPITPGSDVFSEDNSETTISEGECMDPPR